MIYRNDEYADVETATGTMRTHIFRPVAEGEYPAIILYSEIYQVTEPIRRAAEFLAGHGFIVATPEVYHEFEPLGKVLNYDKPDTDRGNELKITKEISAFDSDAKALVEFLKNHPSSSGNIGALGICLGGHLSFRACITEPDIKAGACFYGTDLHQASLGKGQNDGTLSRCAEIKAEMLMIWGKQDPHIPREGRRKIYETMSDADLNFSWHEFNGQHAFMRDVGHRHDPEIARQVWQLTLDHFTRILK
ncbi:dienelactone hydrolase family protein [Luteolibacter sp. AS25]|uniref:dienelactone hydrolase family protein n=1 Tax=Luteolibacter sp. AS25 TaxID=3135776 RepID=UPI00398A5425